MDSRKKLKKAIARLANIDGLKMTEDVWVALVIERVETYFYNLVPKGYSAERIITDSQMDDVFIYLCKKTYATFKDEIKAIIDRMSQPAPPPPPTQGQQNNNQQRTQNNSTTQNNNTNSTNATQQPTDNGTSDNDSDTEQNDTSAGEGANGGDTDGANDEEQTDDEQELIFEILDEGKESITKRIQKTLKKSFESIKKTVSQGLSKLKDGLGKVGNMVKAGFKKAKSNLIAVLLLLFLFFRTNFLAKIRDGFKEQFPHLFEKIEGVVSNIKDYFDKIKEWFKSVNWADKFENLKNTVLDFIETVKGIFGESKAEKAEKIYEESYKILDKNDTFKKLGINERQMAQMDLADIQKNSAYNSLSKQEKAAIDKIKKTDFSDYLSRSEQKALRQANPDIDIKKAAEARLAREQGFFNEKVLEVNGVALDVDEATQMSVMQNAVNDYINNLSVQDLEMLGDSSQINVNKVLEKAGIDTDGTWGASWAGEEGSDLWKKSQDYVRQQVAEKQRIVAEIQASHPQPQGGDVINTSETSVVNFITYYGEPGREEAPN